MCNILKENSQQVNDFCQVVYEVIKSCDRLPVGFISIRKENKNAWTLTKVAFLLKWLFIIKLSLMPPMVDK